MAASPIPLRIDSVVKRFGEVTAVAGISLDVQERTCLGLLGPNGAGKSTLIRSIAGRIRLDSGSIQVFCQPATWKRSANTRGCAAKRCAAPSNGAWSGPRSPTAPIPRSRICRAACVGA